MSKLFDDVTRVVAAPISRRQALKLIASAVGAVILNRLTGAPWPAMAIVCDDPLYPNPCADLCCRYDYFCASTEFRNGSDTYGICCDQNGDHLCSAGGYGWCCMSTEDCGTERFTCTCAAGTESCGNNCCDTAAGGFCCDPSRNLCCAAGVECCYDQYEAGTCCPDDTKCVPISPTGNPPGHVCCPTDQACIGQCCPDGEFCFMNLACCPADRITPDRDGCCPAGFLYHQPTDSCCLEGMFCGDVCCAAGTVCLNGTCQACPGGQDLCFGTCCATGTCCFGKCCGDGQTCTGECTTLETLSVTIPAWDFAILNSSDGGVSIYFNGLSTEERVQYTSQAQPSHSLPEHAQLLRSFTLTSLTAVSRPQQVENVYYTMRVSYTEATLAAMGIESETQLKLLWWDHASSTWIPAFNAEIDRSEEVVIVTQALLGEFALVAGEETQSENSVYLPLVIK